jgi:hypothetical protein
MFASRQDIVQLPNHQNQAEETFLHSSLAQRHWVYSDIALSEGR